jgi:hypothetical protein
VHRWMLQLGCSAKATRCEEGQAVAPFDRQPTSVLLGEAVTGMLKGVLPMMNWQAVPPTRHSTGLPLRPICGSEPLGHAVLDDRHAVIAPAKSRTVMGKPAGQSWVFVAKHSLSTVPLRACTRKFGAAHSQMPFTTIELGMPLQSTCSWVWDV